MTQQSTLSTTVEGLAVVDHRPAADDRRIAWLDTAGINLKIGDPSLSPKDPAQARAVLPKIAAARATVDARVQARTLATVAHLQARTGDLAGALATAESIPDLKRADFPGPSDGFYDAVKLAAFALIGGVMAEANDKPAAAAAFARAAALAHAVGAEDQKLVAQIMIARQQTASGRRDAAKVVVDEALSLALAQPEPRRSRVPTMLAEAQVKAGDAAALRTVDAIRDYPGLEKARALTVLVRQYEESGDAATSVALTRRPIACLEAEASDAPLPGKVTTVRAFARDTFIDFGLEFDPVLVASQRESQLLGLRTRVGEVEAVVPGVNALPAARRVVALPQVIAVLVRRGDVAGAMDLATSIESPEARMHAFATLAANLPDRQTKQ